MIINLLAAINLILQALDIAFNNYKLAKLWMFNLVVLALAEGIFEHTWFLMLGIVIGYIITTVKINFSRK